MRVFGRQFSKWWLLLLVPVLIVCTPVLLIPFFVGNDLAGAIIGPPAIWNRPSHTPAREDLAGSYVEYKRNWDHPKTGPNAVIVLKSDGAMTVSDLTEDSTTSTCNLSGSGRWSGPDEDQYLDDRHIDLVVTSDGVPGTCGSGFLEIAGRSEPYELYSVLGDPDSGTGIWLKRQ